MKHPTTSSDHKIVFKRILRGIIIALSIFIVVSLTAASCVFHFLFSRKANTRLISHYAPVSLSDAPCTYVSIPEQDHNLQGYLFGENSSNGIIIIAHGFHADANCHLGEIMYFYEHGWCVLAFDGTGTGNSDGTSSIGLEQMRLDILSAIDYVQQNEALQNKPIFLYGHSMGGYAAASLCNNPYVAGVVSISGFNAPVETMCYFSRKYVGVLSDIEYPFIFLHDYLQFGKNSNISAVESINSTNTPIFIVYGSMDQTIPYDISIYSHRQEITNPNVSYLLIDQAFRNTHSTGWLSVNSAQNTLELNTKLDALIAQYGGNIPICDQNELASQVAQQDIFEVDEDFMQQVLHFFQSSFVAETAA